MVAPTSGPAVHRLAGPATASAGKIVKRLAYIMGVNDGKKQHAVPAPPYMINAPDGG